MRLPSVASRSSILSGKLDLGELSETVVVVGNAPHDRSGFLVGHLVGNRASFHQCARSQLKFLAISLPRHLSPLMEKAPAIDGRGKLSRAGRHYEFGPSRSAPCRAEHSLVALTTSGDLFIYAKDLFVCAKQQQQ